MTHDESRTVATVITVALTTLALRALFAESFRRTPPVDADGTVLLRYGVGVKAVGIIAGMLVPLGLLGVVLFAPPTRPGQMAPLVGMIVGFALLGVPTLVVAFRSWARVSPAGIEARSALGARSRVLWADVKSVEYSGLRGALLFRDRRGTTVSVPIMAVGLPALLGEMERRLRRDMYEPAVRTGLRQIGRKAA